MTLRFMVRSVFVATMIAGSSLLALAQTPVDPRALIAEQRMAL